MKHESPASPASIEQATPERSELDATEDEDSDDLDSAVKPASTVSGAGAKGKAVRSAERGTKESVGSAATQNVKDQKTASETSSPPPPPPPRRELPFKRDQRIPEKPMPLETAAVEEEGDETSDDEL